MADLESLLNRDPLPARSTRFAGRANNRSALSHRFGTLAGFAVVVVLLGSAGCKVGPDYRRPESAVNGAAAAGTPVDAGAEWWRGFGDSQLDELVSRVSTNNLDLRVAQGRLREARALWTAARFDLVPTVRSDLSLVEETKSHAAQPALGRQARHSELYRAGFDATWELDLWGRVRRGVEAARATVEAVEATRDDVLVVVRAEAAANYLELRGLQAQLGVAQRNATNQANTLKLAEALRDGGEGTQFDVARARSLWNATRAAIPPIEAAIDRAMHRLAVLSGLPATALRAELAVVRPLPGLPTFPKVDDWSPVLRRRPDVRAAERSLAAATARIGIEVAGLFPTVTFVGAVGLQAATLGGLGDSGADAYAFGPHISWAALDLGRVRQRVRAADARAESALAIYERTVLLSLEETENGLAVFRRERQRQEFLRASEQAAAEAVDLARQRYRDGVADFLSVLDAERTLLSLQEQLVLSETRSATSLVAVYKALGIGAGTPAAPTSPPSRPRQ